MKKISFYLIILKFVKEINKIKGKNGISIVYIDAEKENGIWKYNKVIFYKEKGKADSIDLLLNKE